MNRTVLTSTSERIMWDTLETSPTHLSHDMPCPACGHAAHRYWACSDTCACVPAPLPGEHDEPRQVLTLA